MMGGSQCDGVDDANREEWCNDDTEWQGEIYLHKHIASSILEIPDKLENLKQIQLL